MALANAPRRWLLASHVRACECDGHVILLDLRRNRYLGISNFAWEGLVGRLENWPCSSDRARLALGASVTGDLLHQFISQGLVVDTTSAESKTILADTATDTASLSNLNSGLQEATSTIELDPGSCTPSRAITRMLQPARFARSVATAAFWIRTRCLQSIASKVIRHRVRLPSPKVETIEAVKPAVAAYEHLRPFVFTAREQCVLDSLALVHFLAHEGLVARWVVGVRTGPFAAHSWVQAGHTVLNDQHEYVRRFRPILVV